MVGALYRKNPRLISLYTGYESRFNLYCGQIQRNLTDDQVKVMHEIANYVIRDGSISAAELNGTDTGLWRKGVQCMNPAELDNEMKIMARFLLGAA